MIKKLQSIFEKIVNRVENNPVHFSRYIFLFAALLFIRLTLEFFSSRRLFTQDDIIHIGLWFIFIVLAFMVQLKLFSGEKMIKVAKLTIVFFSIALTAPILDLIITKGVGAKMNYLSIKSWEDIWWSYITIGGSSLSRGATPGIRVEIILLLMASFNYVRTKRKSWLWALASAFCIYTVLFLSGAVPLFLSFIVKTFHVQYQHDDQSTLLLLLTLDVFLFLSALFCHVPYHVLRILKAVPWGAFILALFFFVIGAMLAISNYAGNFILSPTTLFWFPLLMVLCFCAAGYTGIQRINNQHGENKKYFGNAANALLVLMLFISCMISAKTFFTLVLLWGLLFLLYEPPLFLKEIPVLRNLLEAMALLSGAFIGFCTFGAPMIGFPYQWLWLILIGTFAAGFFTDMNVRNGSVYILVKNNIVYSKIISSVLLIASFVFGYLLLFNNNITGIFFLSSCIAPLFMIWFKPSKTQLILLSFVPCCVILFLFVLQK